MRAIYLALLIFLILPQAAFADSTITPAGYGLEDEKGNLGLGTPFSNYYKHNQWRLPAEYFQHVGGVIEVHTLSFRSHSDYTLSISRDFADLELALSTCPLEELSLSFAENQGEDRLLVHDGEYSIRTPPVSADKPESVATPFNITIDFSQSFSYDFREGDLLVDFLLKDSSVAGVGVDAFALYNIFPRENYGLRHDLSGSQTILTGSLPVMKLEYTRVDAMPIPPASVMLLFAFALLPLRFRLQA
jgi:hypothetical protein